MAHKGGYDIGMVGLGVMGRNLALNMAEHGSRVAGFDTNAETAGAFAAAGGGENLSVADGLADLAGMLRRPRAVVMLVPAGKAVDAVLEGLQPHLERGDIVIDGGNSHYRDTDRRCEALAGRGLHYLGVGISGGEQGARHGPSIMAGGPREAYQRVRTIFEAIAARAADGEPCAAWMGPRSAGHYVKMVHNGIEYGLMQLIAESYDFMKRSLGFDNDGLQRVYAQWAAHGEPAGYLLEITADIFAREDDLASGRLIDAVLAEAEQKGTGLWTSETALELGVPTPTIDLAVSMRDMSAWKAGRRLAPTLRGPRMNFDGDRLAAVDDLEHALAGAMLLTYAQGFALLARASGAMNYGLDLAGVAGVWRGGCIIRSGMLEDIRAAFRRRADLDDLLLDERIAARAGDLQQGLRRTVAAAALLGLPTPCMAASLAWLDSSRSDWLPANLIQAQRDCFGSHTYRRTDRAGTFHTDWRPAEQPA